MTGSACTPTDTPDDLDLPALRARYAAERDRRMRPDGSAQYVEAAGDLAGYYETDPHSAPIVRGPICDEVDVAILGGGFAGLIVGARLRQAGVDDLRIIEMAGDFGGTWYWNRYPGIQCDNESYVYLPLLEEVGYVPREKYSHGPEIFEHCQRIAKHFDLYDQALFGTTIRELRWDESMRRWRISTAQGDDIRARFFILAAGSQNKPKLPGIPGIREFRGHSFHTSRWDYEYTGGDTFGDLHKLADKKVALIGTGATAIQCVPFLGEAAEHLYVFQRTPSYVGERGNVPTDPDWERSLQPGWQEVRQRAFHTALWEGVATPADDVVCDGWTEIARNLAATLAGRDVGSISGEEMAELRELEDYRAMERLRRRVDEIVDDRATADTLKPWYRFMCKRPCFNDDYLATFNRPNVTLVDVADTQGVERFTGSGVVANGVEHEVDCVIFASGFEITTGLRRRLGIATIEGRGGLSLYDHWADGYRTLHGMTTHGFPNFFYIGYSQSGISAAHNLMYDQQGSHIAHIIGTALERGATWVEPTQAGQDGWCATIREAATTTFLTNSDFAAQCTPGYYNNDGLDSTRSAIFGEPYGPGFYAFGDVLQAWREQGDMAGMRIEP